MEFMYSTQVVKQFQNQFNPRFEQDKEPMTTIWYKLYDGEPVIEIVFCNILVYEFNRSKKIHNYISHLFAYYLSDIPKISPTPYTTRVILPLKMIEEDFGLTPTELLETLKEVNIEAEIYDYFEGKE